MNKINQYVKSLEALCDNQSKLINALKNKINIEERIIQNNEKIINSFKNTIVLTNTINKLALEQKDINNLYSCNYN